MARGGTAMFMLIFQAITAYHLHEVKGKQMNFDLKKLPAYLYVYGVWMVGELIGIYRYQYNEEEELALLEESVQMEKRKQGPSGIQKCFLWDVVVCLLYAMICFSFPTQIMKFTFKKIGTIDSFHKLYFRYYGCYLIYSAMMSSAAYSFPLYMQKSYVVSRIITQAIIFILHMIGHWGYGLYSPNHITPFMVAGFYVTFMTSLFYKIKRRGEKEQVEEEIYEQEETYEQEVSAEEDEEEVEGEQINSRQTKLKTQ
uniref:Elongation of fatty acids protein n=1 Tax=Rhabditophanes sp. KR3021 TaxID=114890 RepID=A0AC35UED3_9BILA